MTTLDLWLVKGQDHYSTPKNVNCKVWGRIYKTVKDTFKTAQTIVDVSCEEIRPDIFFVRVNAIYRGAKVKIGFWYDSEISKSSISEKLERKRRDEGGGLLKQYVADFLYEISDRHTVEIDKYGIIRIDGKEVELWKCMRRQTIDYRCVLSELRQ